MPRKAEGASAGTLHPGPALRKQAMAWAMVLLRVFVGVSFLEAGISKWGWLGSSGLARQLLQWTTGSHPATLSSYISILRQFVLPHAQVFTYLLVFGEILVGGCLILGFLTRAAALPALLMSMNSLLATWNLGTEWQTLNEAFLVMEITLLLTGAGRFCGLDVTLARKHPQWPFW